MKRIYIMLTGIWLLVVAVSLLGAWMLPSGTEFPVHWNLAMEPDRWAGKWTILATGPLLCLLIPVLTRLVIRAETRKQHLVASIKALAVTVVSLQLILALLFCAVVLNASGMPIDIPRLALTSVAVLFIVLGNYLAKIESNFSLGIRTPWTLKSDNVWNKTHQAGGKLFVVSGFLLIAAGLVSLKLAGFLIAPVVLLMVAFLTLYSWYLWKKEKNAT